MLEIFVAIVVFAVAVIVVVLKRGTELRKLAENGVRTEATVEKTWKFTGSTGMATRRMRYRFTASNGKEYKRTVTLTTGESEKLTEGTQTTVIYLADNPKVSSLANLVEQAKQALKK